MRASMQEKLVAGHDGVGLSVRVHDGPDETALGLLLHHGLASSQRIWDLMLPRLRRRFRVVTYDARGHGRSRKPSRGYGFEPLVADARAVIRATGLRRSIVAGHSWGASVALELAARSPRSVAGVVLVDGGLLWLRDPDEALAHLSVPALAVLSRSDDEGWTERRTLIAARLRRTAGPVRVTSMGGIHDLPLQHPSALAGRIERFADQLVR